MADYPLQAKNRQGLGDIRQGYALETASLSAWNLMPGFRLEQELWDQAQLALTHDKLQSYERQANCWGRALIGASTWGQIYSIASSVLGPYSFDFGVACGIMLALHKMEKDMIGMAEGLFSKKTLELAKTFVFAGLYEMIHPGNRGSMASAVGPLMALEMWATGKALEPLLGRQMKEADDHVREMLQELARIMQHPGDLLGKAWDSTKNEYVGKWKRYQQLAKSGGLADQFEAGELLGEVLLEVVLTILAIWSGVELAAAGARAAVGVARSAVRVGAEVMAKLTSEAPELVSVAKGTAEGVGRMGDAAAETAPKPPKTVRESKPAASGSFGKVPDTIKTSSGVDIHPTPGKTTTVLGSFQKGTPGNMDDIINNQLSYPKTTDLGAKLDGFNVLNVPDDAYEEMTRDEFWDAYNKPLLDQAAERGDVIAVATEPTQNVLVNQSTQQLTGFGREMKYLQDTYRLIYDKATGTMIKP